MKNIGIILKGFSQVEQSMPDEVNNHLRSSGVITENEVVLKVGDIYLAYDVVTQNRRKINSSHIVLSENAGTKRLLKG